MILRAKRVTDQNPRRWRARNVRRCLLKERLLGEVASHDIPKRNHQSDASKIVKTIKYLPLRHESNSHFPLNLCKQRASSHKKVAETLVNRYLPSELAAA